MSCVLISKKFHNVDCGSELHRCQHIIHRKFIRDFVRRSMVLETIQFSIQDLSMSYLTISWRIFKDSWF